MMRLVLILLLFLFSLVNFFPVPTIQIWYAGIAITEFPWIFMLVAILLLVWSFASLKFRIPCITTGIITFIILCSPVLRAYIAGADLEKELTGSFGVKNDDLAGFHQAKPFSFTQMFTGNAAKIIPFKTYHYAIHDGVDLTLNFSPSAVPGARPCLVVVHGGSWKGGDNSEIAEVNNYFANAGYQVAAINYRLAPKFHSPAQQKMFMPLLSGLKIRPRN